MTRGGPARGAEHERGSARALRPGDVILSRRAAGGGWRCVTTARDGPRCSRGSAILPGLRDRLRGAAEAVANVDLPRSGSAPSARFRGIWQPAGDAAFGARHTAPRPDPEAEARAAELDRRPPPTPATPARSAAARAMGRASVEARARDRRPRPPDPRRGRRPWPQFDRVVAVLGDLGYVEDFSLTRRATACAGSTARATCCWPRPSPAGCSTGCPRRSSAALVSTLVYEGRERQQARTDLPTPCCAIGTVD